MSEILFLVIFTSTKISEISDMTKCSENFVSQTLGLFIKFYAAELRRYAIAPRVETLRQGTQLHSIVMQFQGWKLERMEEV